MKLAVRELTHTPEQLAVRPELRHLLRFEVQCLDYPSLFTNIEVEPDVYRVKPNTVRDRAVVHFKWMLDRMTVLERRALKTGRTR